MVTTRLSADQLDDTLPSPVVTSAGGFEGRSFLTDMFGLLRAGARFLGNQFVLGVIAAVLFILLFNAAKYHFIDQPRLHDQLKTQALYKSTVCDMLGLSPTCPRDKFIPVISAGYDHPLAYEWELQGIDGCQPFKVWDGYMVENDDGLHNPGDLVACDVRFRIWNEEYRQEAENSLMQPTKKR